MSNNKSRDLSETALLSAIERRVLWLASYMVHYANSVRLNVDGTKVGGHQTSSSSVVTILTALYFDFLRAGDKVSIKPHASPVFHAIQFLLGNLDARYLTTLREFHGLQSYPSRTKDPDPVDFSTGSVGIGSIAPNFAALVHAYLRGRGLLAGSDERRFVSLVGDGELDEGSIWEAIAEPALEDLGSLLWIVDVNRQSLDRVVPGIRARCWHEMFAANGWNVIDVKYGHLLQEAFSLANGELLRSCLDGLSNAAYQRLLRLPGKALREWLPLKSRFPDDLARFISRWDDAELHERFGNLGGHDLGTVREAFGRVGNSGGPCVIFAYTLKGWGLPSVGHPQNHSALLTAAQIEELRVRSGIASGAEFAGFDPDSDEGRFCAQISTRLRRPDNPPASPVAAVPASLGCIHTGHISTQQTFGTTLTAITRESPDLARRIVTMSPDVASSTNLGGWINKSGVWRRAGEAELLPPAAEQSALKWNESPMGQHVELGLSESNLFMALSQFGLSHELFGEMLLPVGTLYDPFIRRGLDAFFYGPYSGSKFIVAGTPSGITLAPEGGAHQSIGTQSIGTEMPELNSYEPCFGQEVEWIFLHALEEIRERRRSTYLRLSTRAIDQSLFHLPRDPSSRARLREHVIRGAYRLIDRTDEENYKPGENVVNLFVAGALVPEAIASSNLLLSRGIFVNVFNLTGPGPLYRDFQAVRSLERALPGETSHLEDLVMEQERAAPAVTLIDDHPHTLAWIGGALGSKVYPLGVSRFGQSGSRTDLYREYGLDTDHIVDTCQHALGSAGISVSLQLP